MQQRNYLCKDKSELEHIYICPKHMPCFFALRNTCRTIRLICVFFFFGKLKSFFFKEANCDICDVVIVYFFCLSECNQCVDVAVIDNDFYELDRQVFHVIDDVITFNFATQ